MSTTRKALRHTLVLSATAGIAALAMSFAEPAAAACRHGCSSGHHSGPAPSSWRHATQAPNIFRPRMSQVPHHTFDPGGSRQAPPVMAQIPGQRFDPNGLSRRPPPNVVSTNSGPGGSNTYDTANGPRTVGTANGPGAVQKSGETTQQTTAPNAKLAARICVLPAGTWCSTTQGDVGMKCHCTESNGGRGSDGIVK
jgi:hypothetical protein